MLQPGKVSKGKIPREVALPITGYYIGRLSKEKADG